MDEGVDSRLDTFPQDQESATLVGIDVTGLEELGP